MRALTIDDEPIGSSGALAVYFAALDELARRYDAPIHRSRVEESEFESPNGFFLVARAEGQLAGGVGLRTITDSSRRLGEVKRLWVRPDLRRSGVAAAMMVEVVERARTLGFRQLYLETGWAQPEALALYPNIGWDPVADFPEGARVHDRSTRFTRVL